MMTMRLTVDWCIENLLAKSLSFRPAARYIRKRNSSSMGYNDCWGKTICLLRQCRMLPGLKKYMHQLNMQIQTVCAGQTTETGSCLLSAALALDVQIFLYTDGSISPQNILKCR